MTTEQFEELKAIQDAYLEMRSKEQVIEEPLDEMDLSSIKGAKPRGSVEDQKKARAEMIAKRDAEKPKSDTKTDVKVDTSRGYGKGRYMGDSVEETGEVLESERSKKFKEIGASLDRMMAKAAANTELQKLKKQNKEHKKLPEEVELDEKELTDIDVKQKEKIVKGMKKNLQAFKDKYGERAKGVMYATATKMAQKMPDVKEEVEELEELSKKTLGSYVKKATSDVGLAGFVKGTTVNDHSRSKDYEDAATMNKKRKIGIAKAVDKLTKEEVEDLEEADTYGWRTNKTPEGHKWTVHSFTYGKGEKVLHQGTEDSRAKAVARAKKHVMPYRRGEKVEESFELDEARAKKEPMEVYHTGYSAALQHAEKHLNKQGYEIHPDDWQQHISHGPSKPSEGKTVQLHVPLHKDGKPSKKVAHIQVYNRGNSIPKNNELNMYVN